MNNCDKLKICARIRISPAIFITREIFADDSVYAIREIDPAKLENTWVRLWQLGHLVRHNFQAIPQCVTKHYRKSDYFTRAVRWKAWCSCKIGSDIMIHHPCCHCPPPTPQQEKWGGRQTPMHAMQYWARALFYILILIIKSSLLTLILHAWSTNADIIR